MKLLSLALILMSSSSAAAPEIAAPGDDELFLSSAPASQAVDAEGAGLRVSAPVRKVSASASGKKPQEPGQGGLIDVQMAKPQDLNMHAKQAAAAKPTATEASAPAGKPPIVFQHFKDLPFSTMATLHKKLDFSGGPGTTNSVGFEAVDGGGGFQWAEERNTYRCRYLSWFSLTPGGPAIADDFPKAHNFCKVESDVIDAAWWSTDAPKQQNIGSCHLKPGQRYYFNMQLTQWLSSLEDPKFFACDEYLGVMGNAGGDLWHQ